MTSAPVVLVTGAGGFVGGRVVEVLHCSGTGAVRAGVRRWASAARIGRLPVEIVGLDVTDVGQARRALQGAWAVVHCAVGSRAVTVDGTEVMLRAAREAGVRRFVHVSSVSVYGDVSGDVDESHPLRYSGAEYPDAKVDAEKACLEALADGLPVSILRPTLVHGPFGGSWTLEFVGRLQAPRWTLPETLCDGTCNLLYVDDLVAATQLALARDDAVGQAFNINGPERPTWHDYFLALNAAMGLPDLHPHSVARSRLTAALMAPVRAAGKVALRHFRGPITAVHQRSALASRFMTWADTAIRRSPTTREFGMYSKRVSFTTAKAERMLGYRPAFPLARALELTVAWLRHHGYVRESGRPVAV